MAAEGPSLWGRMTDKRSARGQIISLTRRLLVLKKRGPAAAGAATCGWSSWADIEAVDSEQRRAELEGEHGLLSAETGGEKQDCSLLSRSAFGGRSGVLLSERVRVRVIDRSHPSWPPRAGGRAVRPDDDGDL